ncbi:hypothetical protein [Nocardioides sp. W7]|uniref:hypothetical protein n=1 Tax=Nocardioides sp. W7 TaxID=2931390 RepID=UPI001FD063D3|nr:hypothetical protein [Nocardioides sp. W7]
MHYHYDRTLRHHPEWAAVPPLERSYAGEQLTTLFWALVGRIKVDRWVNDPWAVRAAENKLVQLDAAAACGLRTPRTLVTSSAEQVRAWAAQSTTQVVSKSLDSPVVTVSDASARFLYTASADAAPAEDLPYPHLFQERIVADAELRITVVGRRMFAARIRRGNGDDVDWRQRTPGPSEFEATSLPDGLRTSLDLLMQRLGLSFGGVDILCSGEDHHFLEVNPSGAFLWLERSLDIRISDTVVQLLLAGG